MLGCGEAGADRVVGVGGDCEHADRRTRGRVGGDGVEVAFQVRGGGNRGPGQIARQCRCWVGRHPERLQSS